MTIQRSIFGSLLTLLAMLAWSCQPAPQTAQTTTPTTQVFGADFDAATAITYDELLQKIAQSDSVATTVKGTVSAVCQAKGCWLNLKSDTQTDAEEMLVEFKDYAFFVPKEIADKKVALQGYAYYETSSVEELKHIAEDEGKSAEEIAAIKEPQRELKFMASGVKILQ